MHRKNLVLAVAVLAASAASARAESGEYAFEVPLAAVSPAGEFPIRLETPTFLVEGTVRIALDASGRLSAGAELAGRHVEFTGRFTAARGVERISLKVPGRGGARLNGVLSGTTFTGSFVDGGSLTEGTGTFTIDVSAAHPLVASVTASAHGGFGSTRRGIGTVSAEGVGGALGIDVLPGLRTQLRVRGAGFRCSASGTLLPSSLDVTKWTAKGYGVTVAGTTLTVTHDPVPDVALLVANGDPKEGPEGADPADLTRDAVPFLEHWLLGRGLETRTSVFADTDEDETDPGYSGMVAKLTELRDTLLTGRTFPTRIVVVGFGHGAVRAHAAIRDVPDTPVAALIDLDATSCGWTAQGHDTDAIGGDPVGAYTIGTIPFDLTDIVFDNVIASLDVRSAWECPPALLGAGPDEYEPRVHRREDGAIDGVAFLYTQTSHDELHDPFGTTLPRVAKWLTSTLAPRMKR